MNTRFYALCAALLLLAALLRLHRLDTVDLRGDEAFAAEWWTLTPFSDPWWVLLRTEPNPGAIVGTWAWTRLTGTTELALRMLPLLADLLGLAGTIALVRRLFSPRESASALAAGLLYALHPLLIWHAQDARVYALVAALTPLNTLLLLRAVRWPRVARWAAYGLVQVATLYLYYLDALWVAGRAVYVLAVSRARPRLLVPALITAALAGLVSLPLLAQIYSVAVVSGYQGNTAPADPAALLGRILPALLFGDAAVSPLSLIVGLAVAGLCLVGAVRLVRAAPEGGAVLFGWAVPFALYVLVSTRVSLFIPRYAIALVPLTIVLVIAALRPARPAARWAALTLIALLALVRVYAYFYVDPAKSPDWRGLSAYLSARATPHDVVISGLADPAIQYYYDGQVYYVPITPVDLPSEVARLLDSHTALYVLADARTGDVQAQLQRDAQHIPGDTYPGVNQYRRWSVDPSEIAVPLDLDIGGVARLRGVTRLGTQTLLLYWEALATTTDDHSVLVHLVPADTPESPPVAVLDHAPAAAVVSTRTWRPGVIYRDPLALPPDLPPGRYTVLVGLYPAGDPVLLPVPGDPDGRIPVLTFSR